MKPGDTAYIVENGNRITQVQIILIVGEMYTCKLPSGGAIRLSKKRFYQFEEEANRHKIKRPIRRSPYDFE